MGCTALESRQWCSWRPRPVTRRVCIYSLRGGAAGLFVKRGRTSRIHAGRRPSELRCEHVYMQRKEVWTALC